VSVVPVNAYIPQTFVALSRERLSPKRQVGVEAVDACCSDGVHEMRCGKLCDASKRTVYACHDTDSMVSAVLSECRKVRFSQVGG
jgi:hypothetical protein